jgi:molecular chaperone HscB
MKSADLSSSYFELFDLPVSFDVDRKILTERYRTLQRTVHPDRFANAAESERRLSVQMATRINEGYQTLKDSLARGRYLLELNGVELNDLDTAFDDGFLMEQIELREHLGAVKECDDPQQQLKKITGDIRIRVKEITENLAVLFRESNAEGNIAALEKARELTRKLQFFRRLEDEIDTLEGDLSGF